jgi:hypothetical protein
LNFSCQHSHQSKIYCQILILIFLNFIKHFLVILRAFQHTFLVPIIFRFLLNIFLIYFFIFSYFLCGNSKINNNKYQITNLNHLVEVGPINKIKLWRCKFETKCKIHFSVKDKNHVIQVQRYNFWSFAGMGVGCLSQNFDCFWKCMAHMDSKEMKS